MESTSASSHACFQIIHTPASQSRITTKVLLKIKKFIFLNEIKSVSQRNNKIKIVFHRVEFSFIPEYFYEVRSIIRQLGVHCLSRTK